jgi:hypothetical protein
MAPALKRMEGTALDLDPVAAAAALVPRVHVPADPRRGGGPGDPKEPARDFPANQLLRAFRTGASGCNSHPDRKDPPRSWRQEPGD